MQSAQDVPLPMPNEESHSEGYRTEYGTSVAVRLDPGKEFGEINLCKFICSFL